MSLCRICVEKRPKIIEFTNSDECLQVLCKIFECTQINLSYDPNCLFVLCKDCLGQLEIAYDFREKVVQSAKKILEVKDECVSECKSKAEHDADAGTDTSQPSLKLETDDTALLDIIKEEETSPLDVTPSPTSVKCDEAKEGYTCDICGKTLKSLRSLKSHIVSMHKKRKYTARVVGCGADRRFCCTQCSYTSPFQNSLKYHIYTHTGEKPYKCHCGKSFSQQSSLITHKKYIHGTHSLGFNCTECKKLFKHDRSFSQHMQRVHNNVSFSCQICDKILKSKATLKEHMNRHDKIRNYNCEQCGLTFYSHAELVVHREKHLEKKQQKTVLCDHCGFETSKKKTLISHIQRHMKIKPFQCLLCGLAFYSRDELKIHHRVHTKEQPYSCRVCGKKFTTNSSANKHVKRSHGVAFKKLVDKVKH